jgi:hypothetical protein
MAEALVAHQRQSSSSCLCGWAKLGYSHAGHQAEALTAAGFGRKADAWDEGHLDAIMKYAPTPSSGVMNNPYRVGVGE